jgi:DNA-binding NarL/FixJ family response regulator
MIRVVVAARRTLTRAGLESLVRSQANFTLTGSVPDLGMLSTILDERGADVALAAWEDGSLPEEPGFHGTPIVLLADNPEPAWIADALRSGIRAALPSQSPPAQIAAALEAAAAGLSVLQPEDLIALLAHQPPVPASLAEPLTPREIEVLGMMSEGLSNKLIAARLGISDHTVKFHVTSIMSKMNAGSRTEAVTRGIRQGLVIL